MTCMLFFCIITQTSLSGRIFSWLVIWTARMNGVGGLRVLCLLVLQAIRMAIADIFSNSWVSFWCSLNRLIFQNIDMRSVVRRCTHTNCTVTIKHRVICVVKEVFQRPQLTFSISWTILTTCTKAPHWYTAERPLFSAKCDPLVLQRRMTLHLLARIWASYLRLLFGFWPTVNSFKFNEQAIIQTFAKKVLIMLYSLCAIGVWSSFMNRCFILCPYFRKIRFAFSAICAAVGCWK